MESSLRNDAPAGLTLIETLRWEPRAGFVRLAAHLARLAAGAGALGIALDRAAAERALGVALGGEALGGVAGGGVAGGGVAGDAPRRVRLTLGLDGRVAVTSAPLGAAKAAWTVTLATPRLRADDPWLRLKSTRRPVHDAARAALPAGVDEALLLNERGELCEGTITSVFVDRGDGLLTPPLASGLLPGILRAELLAAGRAREALLRPADLAGGRLFLGNSLRGLIPARFDQRA